MTADPARARTSASGSAARPIVEDASLALRARRIDGAGRPERRRQDHADARARRPAAGATAASSSTAGRSRDLRRASGRAASPICRRATSSIGRCRWPRSWRSAAIRMAIRSRAPTEPTAPPSQRALAATGDRSLRRAAGHHAVRRRTRAGGAGARAGDRSRRAARRRADRVARSAPSARGDGAAARRRARGRRGAGGGARSGARRALRRPRAGDGPRPARRRRAARRSAERGSGSPRCSASRP